MDESEAFEKLGLEPSATEEEIKERYRELVPQNHPDAEGTSEDMEELNTAKEVALASSSDDLVKTEALEDSIRLSTQQEQQRIESEKTVERLIDRGTSRYRRFRQMTIIFGGISAILGVVIQTGSFRIEYFPVSITAGVFLVISLIYTYIFHASMQNIELMINEADEALSDKMEYIRLLEDIGIRYQDDPRFTESELENAIEEWIDDTNSTTSFFAKGFLKPKLDFESLAGHVGPSDFSRLVIRKGLEKDILSELEEIDDNQWIVKYEFNVPSEDTE